jgi:16S rRNA (guanine527-N7)-methyltransferase
MDTSVAAQLKAGVADLGLNLDDTQLGQFVRYGQLLEEWNARMNLTRVPSEEVVPLHFLDSLLVCRAVDLQPGDRLIDVGSGAGFPGLPLKIAFPSISVTLLDSTRKRLAFLEAVIQDLGLTAANTLHSRAEDAGRDPRHRDHYDVVTARAVARLGKLAEWLLPFVKPGGAAVALKSAGADEEIDETVGALVKLGSKLESVVALRIPQTDIERKLVVLRKEKPTPARYPRPAAEIKARPLT